MSQDAVPLLGTDESSEFRERWSSIQGDFVDRPQQSVQQADALVGELMMELEATFQKERETLESHFNKTNRISTEELRVALQRYRSFFERLLSA
jgi:polyhydroxyalkanoate synthesis regulator phasin